METGIIRMREQNEFIEGLHTSIYKMLMWSFICVFSCSAIVLLITGLIVGYVNGKNDALSENLLIAFCSIIGFMGFVGLSYCICAICNDDI